MFEFRKYHEIFCCDRPIGSHDRIEFYQNMCLRKINYVILCWTLKLFESDSSVLANHIDYWIQRTNRKACMKNQLVTYLYPLNKLDQTQVLFRNPLVPIVSICNQDYSHIGPLENPLIQFYRLILYKMFHRHKMAYFPWLEHNEEKTSNFDMMNRLFL